MDSYISLSNLQMPFQRRLSRLYNDTKKSSDFVKEPVQNAEDPEIKALHRKLRIQKDRLVSWGLEWSDPSQSSEVLIDSSLSRAGLSEVVGSIMSTIKETLAEVEPLWLSSKRLVGGGGGGGGGGDRDRLSDPDKKGSSADRDRDRDLDRKLLPTVTWDKARFADLVRDLTVSIDTLYDLSRTRSSAATTASDAHTAAAVAAADAGRSSKAKQASTFPRAEHLRSSAGPPPQPRSRYYKTPADDAKLFEPSRMQVPQQIDPVTLTSIESSTRPPEDPKTREVVYMSKQAYADLAPASRLPGQSYAPLLLEYAYFDPVYAATGIMPAMARFEKLSSGLRGETQRSLSASYTGLPRLLGYFEDMEHARLGLVYQFPASFHAIVAASEAAATATLSPQNLRSCLYSLGDLLGSPGFEPKLEAKFRLAFNLANAVFEMHAKGIVHGNLVDGSILFGHAADAGTAPPGQLLASNVAQVDIRKPLIASFDLFPDTPGPGTSEIKRRSSQLHRHPLNPLSFAPGAPPIVDADPRVFDLYSLAMLLLSIGMWTRLENLVPHNDSAMVSEAVLEQLSTQCGTLYMRAVQTCWNAMEMVVSAGKAAGDSHLARLQVRASSYLEACCVLDDVSALERRLRNDLGGDDLFAAATATTATTTATRATAPPTPTTARPPPPLKAASLPPPAPLTAPPPLQRRSRTTRVAPPAKDRFAVDDAVSGSVVRVPPGEGRPPPVPPKTNVSLSEAAAATTKTTSTSTTPTVVPKPPQRDTSAAKAEPVRMRLYPQVPLPPDVVEKWHTFLMPQINAALRHFYRSHPESVEISLESVGDSPRTTRPTVVVVCTSVAKVRSILKRKLGPVFEGSSSSGGGGGGGVGLKVCSGRVMRSRKSGFAGPGSASMRSQGHGFGGGANLGFAAANSQFQQKPQNGASIGAWIGDRHLPPVSFGGLVLVDDKPFGMTVHHMLDDPDANNTAVGAAVRSSGGAAAAAARSGRDDSTAANDVDVDVDVDEATADSHAVEELGQSVLDWYAELQADSSAASTSGDDYACEFSDTSSVSESDVTSEWSDSEYDERDEGEEDDAHDDDKQGDEKDAAHEGEPGDVPGVEPGYGDGYVVTQPALDDVDGNFYPDEATQDDDHLDSCGLGDVYASSGVRRRVDAHGLVHEIDWALFEFKEERLPAENAIPHLPLAGGENRVKDKETAEQAPSSSLVSSSSSSSSVPLLLRPTTVAPASALPGLEVQCMARTSGLQTGRILPTITSVKIYGRTSPSHTYQISAAMAASSGGSETRTRSAAPIGIPGDSGAWIVERTHGRLCGHVLAWSERKRVAYLCPMDVLLLDIAETLAAGEVRLPGGEAVVKILEGAERKSKAAVTSTVDGVDGANVDEDDEEEEKDEEKDKDGESQAGCKSFVELDGGAGSSSSDRSPQSGKGGWVESTKMMEIVGSMSKVRLSGKDVRTPC